MSVMGTLLRFMVVFFLMHALGTVAYLVYMSGGIGMLLFLNEGEILDGVQLQLLLLIFSVPIALSMLSFELIFHKNYFKQFIAGIFKGWVVVLMLLIIINSLVRVRLVSASNTTPRVSHIA